MGRLLLSVRGNVLEEERDVWLVGGWRWLVDAQP